MNTVAKNDYMKVFTSREYEKFKSLNGNRDIKAGHLKKLKASIKKTPLLSPIIVNERFEIIDGQHRFTARKELNLPIPYIIAEGYGLKEVQIMNSISKTWSPDDYMEAYIQLGNEDYVLYKKFREEYKFSHKECYLMLAGGNYSGGDTYAFREGNFKIIDYKKSVQIADNIVKVGEFFEDFRQAHFVKALLRCFNIPEYDHKVFLTKLQYQSSKLVKCTDIKQYLGIIEEIYNFKSQNKVVLRYAK